MSDYTEFVNPQVGRMLRAIGLDVAYVRGEGTRLFDADGAAYLDFAGAYGALPFGHNPAAVWAAIDDIRRSGEPSLVQPSLSPAAGALARRLTEMGPGRMRTAFLCNSGAEAVEAAIKAARAATGRPLVLSATGGFHGKTLGALSATPRDAYQRPFGAPAGGFRAVPYGDLAALEAVLREAGARTAALVLEPVQGEGGVVCPPPGYLPAAAALCRDHGVLLVLDEVQTGLGRTGLLFAAEREGVTPDAVTVAKALGGGLVPLGAVLLAETALSDDFALRHTSTFGGNSFCARIGLRTLDLLTADDRALVRQAGRRGERLKAGLSELAGRHPGLVRDVRGEGLLLGVELSTEDDGYPGQGLARSLAGQESLVAVLCGHLLRRHRVRVAPAYLAGSVLRVEPPLTVSEDECDTFLTAMEDALGLLARGDSGTFLAHLTDRPGHRGRVVRPRAVPRPAVGEPRWAFLVHPTDAASYESFDDGLALPGPQVRQLFDRLAAARNADTPAAMRLGRCRLRADDGSTSYGEFHALPYDARTLLDLPTDEAVRLVTDAVTAMAARGAQIVGLGAYTSIITANATALGAVPVPVTTGNAYTVASAVEGVHRVAAERGADLAGGECLVLGAAGSIGRAAALLLAESAGALVLAGNPRGGPAGLRRLDRVSAEVTAHLRGVDGPGGALLAAVRSGADPAAAGLIRTTLEPAAAMATAGVVVAATSTPGSIVDPAALRRGAIVCDIAQPANVDHDAVADRPDLAVFAGGLIDLPGGHDLGIGLGLPPGVTYACAAETMILGHLGRVTGGSRGADLSIEAVRRLRHSAARLGFRLHLSLTLPQRSPT